jgi:L-fuculose-phosphate aldolase
MTEAAARSQIVDVCRRLYARNLLAASDGNVSIRLDDGQILITPSGRQKGFITPEEVAITDLEGKAIAGKPSGEQAMHLHIYRTCPQARAVVHAHPPHAIAWSLARPELRELPAEAFSEVILGCGRIPIVPYARPTTDAMGTELNPFLKVARAMILARHGAVCWGESAEEALNGMERLEHAAYILWIAESLGGAKPLPSSEIEVLRGMRAKMGDRLL